MQGDQARERLWGLQSGVLRPIDELHHLHQKLDVDDTAGPTFEIRGRSAVLHAVPHAADAFDRGTIPEMTVGRPLQDRFHPLSRRCRSHHHAGLRQRLPLPDRGWPTFGKILREGLQRDCSRATLAAGPEPRIDLIEPAIRAKSRRGLHHLLSQRAKEMGVAGGFRSAACSPCGNRDPIVIVKKDQIDIAVVVHLPTTKLAHRQDDTAGPLLSAGGCRFSQSLNELRLLVLHDPGEDRFRHAAERMGGGCHVLLPEDIAYAHAELLRGLEGMQDRLRIDRSLTPVAEHRSEFHTGRQTPHQQTIKQFIDHARVADEEPGEIRTRGTQPHIEIE